MPWRAGCRHDGKRETDNTARGTLIVKVRTFMSKSNLDGLSQCDEQINRWLAREHVDVVFVKQSSGYERHHGQNSDPIVVTSVWYNERSEL